MFSYFPTSYDTDLETLNTSTFNSEEFEYNFSGATKADLQSYAHKYQTNVFSNVNYFTDIFVSNVNGVSSTVLAFLTNITEDVQEKLNWLTTNVTTMTETLTGIYYDEIN
jgi:hypothetical protein